MPVIIPSTLPAKKLLEKEHIFVMTDMRAKTQEIRPLSIGILNLMPNKEETELELLRLIGNTPLQVEITLLQTASYTPTHTSEEHLNSFYLTFEEAVEKGIKFDGFIITGAPVELMNFEDVKYWEEMKKIMDWAEHNVFSTMYICWAAIAGLYYFYDVNKIQLKKKLSGIYTHRTIRGENPLVRNFDDFFKVPHSRHCGIDEDKVKKIEDIEILAESEEAGLYLMTSKDHRRVFVLGHGEYDQYSLDKEYKRDMAQGRPDVEEPVHYYFDGKPILSWRAHSALLMSNWLNYYVYQETPYDINAIK